MTEFEMAYLLTDMQAALATQGALFFTLVSGFLVTSFVAAHRLTRLMVVVAITLYTAFYLQMIFTFSRMGISMAGLVQQMHQFAADGKGLAWHAASNAVPEWALQMAPYPAYLSGTLVYAATIIFFFHCRHVNHKAETQTWKPRV